MLYRRIDTETGIFIEDCIFDSQPTIETENGEQIIDPQYIESEPPQGLYLPKWTGTEWVEGGTVPTPTAQAPTNEERLIMLENAVLTLMME